MLVLLLFGYCFFVVYFVVAVLIIGLFVRRFTQKRNRRSQSSKILKSISRIKFSEELFGAISEENECIICMETYNES